MIRFWAFFNLFLLLALANTGKDTNSTEATNASSESSNQITSVASNTTTGTTVSAGTRLTNTTTTDTGNGDEPERSMLDVLLSSVQNKHVIIAFVVGVTLTAILWGLTHLCCRLKRKSSLNMSDTLEMVSTTALKATGQQDKSTQTHGGADDVEYSDIDFSALRKQRAEERKPHETESEYAEIKREMTEEQGGGGEEHGGEGERQGGEGEEHGGEGEKQGGEGKEHGGEGEKQGGEGEEQGGEEGEEKEEMLDSPTCDQTEGEMKETQCLLKDDSEE